HAAYAAFAQQQRLVSASSEIDSVLFVNLALDPVRCFAEVVDALHRVSRNRKIETKKVAHQIPVILKTKAAVGRQFVGSDGDESRSHGIHGACDVAHNQAGTAIPEGPASFCVGGTFRIDQSVGDDFSAA